MAKKKTEEIADQADKLDCSDCGVGVGGLHTLSYHLGFGVVAPPAGAGITVDSGVIITVDSGVIGQKQEGAWACPRITISADSELGMRMMVHLSHWAMATLDRQTGQAFREKVREFELWREANL